MRNVFFLPLFLGDDFTMCIVRTEANYAFACFNNNDCIPQFVRKMVKYKMSRIQISENTFI